jgi:hypothetical protein
MGVVPAFWRASQENSCDLREKNCLALTCIEEIEQKETKITKVFVVWAEQNLCCLCYLLFRIFVGFAARERLADIQNISFLASFRVFGGSL